MMQEKMGFGDAVASAGPYANNLHLAPDRHHTNTAPLHFYRLYTLPDAQTTGQSTEGKSDVLYIEIFCFHFEIQIFLSALWTYILEYVSSFYRVSFLIYTSQRYFADCD